MKHSISAVIPNFNGKRLLENNLPSLFRELEFSGVDFEVIVVDDCSTDDSIDFITSQYPQIVLVEQSANHGFSVSCNAGINVATKDLVFLMNSDIMLTENYFAPQFRFFENEDTFGVMGKIIGYFDDKVQDTAKYPKMKGLKLKATINYFLSEKNSTPQTPSFYLSGANALVSKKKLDMIGGFDEIFSPFYSEDLDLGIRAWRMGWSCYYQPLSVCRHEGSVSTNKLRKNWVDTIYRRNRFIVHAIHLPLIKLLFYNLQIIFELLFRWVNFRFGVYKGFWQYITMYPKIFESRRKNERMRGNKTQSRSLSMSITAFKTQLKDQKIEFL